MALDDERGLTVLVADERGRPVPAARLAGWLRRVAPSRARGSVNVALVSDARVRALNRTYRRKDYVTDVLSFPAAPVTPPGRFRRTRTRNAAVPSTFPPSAGVERLLGDIVIARGVARRQARRAGHSAGTELRVLALHGLLHLLGYDHEGDHGRMERLEARLRRKGGLRLGLIERRGAPDARKGERQMASRAGARRRAGKR